jgi:hypothetical protein
MSMYSSSSIPAIAAAADDVGPGPRFSEELSRLAARFNESASLADIIEATGGRGYYFTLILLAVPVATPIQVPGVSIPVGLAIAVVGLRQLFKRGAWMPERLLKRKISPRLLTAAFQMMGRLMRKVEVIVRPRLGFVSNHVGFSRAAGAMIAIAGVMVMVPLPLSNLLPAWTVILLSIGALGRDGVFFAAGCAAFLASVALFVIVAYGGVEAIDLIWWVFSR